MAGQPDPFERTIQVAVLTALVASAWVALGLLGASPYAAYVSHDAIAENVSVPLGLRLAGFVAGWTLMSVAMMLPSSLPLVGVFQTITRGAPALVALLIGGYLAVWGLFGGLAVLGDLGLHALSDAGVVDERLVVPAVLIAAGLFQFSPVKHACLTRCRSPLGFVIEHWHGRRRRAEAFTLGVRHGMFCIGCCWALMLLMLAVGGADLGWMLALGAVMFVEKVVGWGRRVTAPVGVLLTAWGVALLARWPGVPAPF